MVHYIPKLTNLLINFQKKKGMFHHSSFLAGGATIAAGRLEAELGILKVFFRKAGHVVNSVKRCKSYAKLKSYNMEI